MDSKLWLRTTGLDGNQHVVWKPEQRSHILGASCPCMPRVMKTRGKDIVIHAVLSGNVEGKMADS